MITLFRKIRRTLIESNSTRKYLLYAIGEIGLVVIGILIAVQVNNWNENRLERKLERQLLIQLIEDLKIDDQRLYMLDTIYATRLKNNKKAVQLFKQAKSITDIQEMIHLADWFARNLALQTSTFDEMISSGSLYSIRNKATLKAITNHYKTADKYDQYTKEYHASLLTKWDQPAFAPFGNLLVQYQNQSEYSALDTDWIGQITHPTFQAALFALEYNSNALLQKQRIVRGVKNSTSELMQLLEASMELE